MFNFLNSLSRKSKRTVLLGVDITLLPVGHL